MVLFAGMGGACDGLEAAGLPVHIAANHCAIAVAVHEHRHPHTRHRRVDVLELDPRQEAGGQAVNVLWASPDCRHFSPAKGGAPVSPRVRSLPWVVCRWAGQVAPTVIFTENVPAIRTWGPLVAKRDPKTGRVLKRDRTVAEPGERVPVQDQQLVPDRRRRGKTFRRWVRHLQELGYAVEHRDLTAADYGVPTTRKRFFMVARRDGRPIAWPAPTHAPRDKAAALGLIPWVPAWTVLDWSLPMRSIFGRPKPLADATLCRIARGVVRYVLKSAAPFILSAGGSDARVTTFLNRFHGERRAGEVRGADLAEPLPTLSTSNRFGLCAAFLGKHYSGVTGHDLHRPIGTITTIDHHTVTAAHLVKLRGACTGNDLRQPLPTLTAGGNHLGLIAPFLVKYYGTGGQDQDIQDPLHTVTTKDRAALVTVAIDRQTYVMADILMRMLAPHEAAAAHGFPAGCLPDVVLVDGRKKRLSKDERMGLVGNSVPPTLARVLAQANSVLALDEPHRAMEVA